MKYYQGHASGILSGFLISWGFFNWISKYLFLCLVLWWGIALLWSIKRTLQPRWLWFLSLSPAASGSADPEESSSSTAARLENGILIRSGSNSSSEEGEAEADQQQV